MRWPATRLARACAIAAALAALAGVLAGAGPATGKRGSGPGARAPATPAKKKRKSGKSVRVICQARPGKGQKANVAKRSPVTAICRPGPTGPQGPAGPPGPTGAGPAGPLRIVVPRTTIPFTTNFMTDGGNVVNLVKIGPIHIDGLCRRTFSPGTGGGQSAGPQHPNPRLPFRGGESEAQILVWSETGSLTFKGQVGPRKNVPPGPPDFTTESGGTSPGPGRVNSPTGSTDRPVSDPVAGEGDHLFLAASNEEVDADRATDPAADNPSASGVRQLSEYPAFQYAGGFIGTSDGHAVLADMVGGFDVLGVYGECVFGGVVRSL